MTLRRVIIRTMLFSLVAAAGCAILFILVPANSTLAGQFIGTSIVIAVACGAALPALPKGENQRPSLEWLVGLAVLGIETGLGLLLIWTDGNFWGWEERAIASMFLLFGGYAFAFVPLRHLGKTRGPMHRACEVAVGAISLATLGVIAAWALRPGTGFGGWQLIPTWWVMMAWIVVSGICAIGFTPPHSISRRTVAIVGIFGATIASAVMIVVIHNNSNTFGAPPLMVGSISAGLAGSAAVLSLVGSVTLGTHDRRCALGLAAMLVVSGVLAAWLSALDTTSRRDDWIPRLFFASLIADGCLGLAALILYRVGRRGFLREWELDGTDVRCPRCGKKGFFKIGSHPCGHCGLRVLMAFEDDQCPRCRHDLRSLPSGHPCPECGLMPERSASNYLAAAGSTSSGDQRATSV